MKTAKDPRHKSRIKIVKSLFAESFTNQQKLPKTVREILKKADIIDKKIQKAAPTWPVDKLNKIDLAILRLAIYELETADTPPKVVIDEAVELAKEFGGENSPSFINGVLGTIYKKEKSMDESDKVNTAKKIIELLSQHIGVEPEDIDKEDSFIEDLSISTSELSDFLHTLEQNGYNTTDINIAEIQTVEELIERISP
ncbi:MAG: transcription antitermination factor NusB [Candidatus Woesebacteria bacterium]|jgi:N utilization substance protein B